MSAVGGTGCLRQRGRSLVEALVALHLLGLAAVAAAPAADALRERGRAAAGARHVASTFHALRWKAVALRRARGLFFEPRGTEWVFFHVEDGNGNGLRTAEIRSGVDRILSGPHRLGDSIEGVRLGFPASGPFPEIPPKTGRIGDLDDPVQFGRSDLVSFTTGGSASSGTLYVTDGRAALYGVVLFGATARVRVWRYDARSGRWSL